MYFSFLRRFFPSAEPLASTGPQHRGAIAGALAALALIFTPLVVEAPALARSTTIAVVGDSIANDLGNGMRAYFANNANVNVVTNTRHSTGLVRPDYFDWNAEARRFVRGTKADAIVVVMGGNDRQNIRTDGRRLNRFTKPWLAEYERRVARFMGILQNAKAPVYWVGLPPVRSNVMSRNYRQMNSIFQRQAAKHNIRFVSVWDALSDERGRYTSFGRDPQGVRRQLRSEDGMHFNPQGRLTLAAFVARQIGKAGGPRASR